MRTLILGLALFISPIAFADDVGQIVNPEKPEEVVAYPESRIYLNAPGMKPLYVAGTDMEHFEHHVKRPEGKTFSISIFTNDGSLVTGNYVYLGLPGAKSEVQNWRGRLESCPNGRDWRVVWFEGASDLLLGYANKEGLDACTSEERVAGRRFGEIIGSETSETGVFVVR